MLPEIEKLTPAQMRARIARAERSAKRQDTPEQRDRVRALRADYAAEKLAEYIEQVIAAAPPLTPEQRDRLALLLRPTSGAA